LARICNRIISVSDTVAGELKKEYPKMDPYIIPLIERYATELLGRINRNVCGVNSNPPDYKYRSGDVDGVRLVGNMVSALKEADDALTKAKKEEDVRVRLTKDRWTTDL